jgi:hypothetical protein
MGEAQSARDAAAVGRCGCRESGQSRVRTDQMQRRINNRLFGGASKSQSENADCGAMGRVLHCHYRRDRYRRNTSHDAFGDSRLGALCGRLYVKD